MRRVLAIGGGGFLMEDSPSPIDEYLCRLTGKSRPRICFISTPSGDLPDHIEKFYSAFSSQSCSPSHLAFFRKPSTGSVSLTSLPEHVLSQDAVFVGGGSTKSALGTWREWGLDYVLSQAYSSGVILAGMSAGAMCWFEAGLTDSYWDAGYQPLRCLGLLPGGCGVHHNSEPDRRRRLHTAIESGAIPPSFAIDDFAAILFENEVAVQSLCWAEGAGAYSITLRDGRALEVALESTPIGREV
ncbi:MAG: Type 1 glutamine amidotransferase-like domain-containing protein [Burkholderiales bacterium]